MKNKLSEKEEANALIDDTNYVINWLIGDFVKYHAGKGHLEVRKESENFVLTMRLERKKEIKKGNEKG